MIYILIPLAFILLISFYSFIEQKFLSLTSYTITSDKLDEEFSGKSFVILADLHNKSFGMDNRILLSRIEELSPDFIIIAGDLITKNQLAVPSTAYNLIINLVKKFDIYYAYGNHEQYMDALNESSDIEKQNIYNSWMEYVRTLKEHGVFFLDNESLSIKGKHNDIRITGLSLGREYFDRIKSPTIDIQYLDSLIPHEVNNDSTNPYEILIAHNPVYYSSYAKWGADLVISGHLHGGALRLPFIGGIISPQIRLFPKFDAGLFNKNGHSLIVSRGLGTHSGIPRIFNRPELISVKLNNKYL